MTTVVGRDRLSWRKSPDGLALHCEGPRGRSPLLHVVPDVEQLSLWRIRYPDGSLSDATNLTWAKDGAIALALGLLNRKRAQERALGASPVRPKTRLSVGGSRLRKCACGAK